MFEWELNPQLSPDLKTKVVLQYEKHLQLLGPKPDDLLTEKENVFHFYPDIYIQPAVTMGVKARLHVCNMQSWN